MELQSHQHQWVAVWGNVSLCGELVSTTIICINDPYDYAESIKDDEHELRIQGQDPIPNVYYGDPSLLTLRCQAPHHAHVHQCRVGVDTKSFFESS